MPTLDLVINARGAVVGAKQAQQALRGVSTGAAQATAATRGTTQSMDRFGKSSTGAARGMGGLISAFAALAGLRAATRTIGGFEEAMARVEGVVHDATLSMAEQEEQIKRLRDVARQLGATQPFTAAESAQGLLNLARAGFTAGEAISAVETVLQLALTAQIDLGESSKLVANTIRQFGLAATDAARVGDVLATTASKANTNITELGDAFKLAGPFAKATGLTVEQTAAALGVLADNALKASIGGTNLRGVLIGLIDPNTAGQAILDRINKSEKARTDLSEGLIPVLRKLNKEQLEAAETLGLFNRRSVAGGIALIDQVEKVDRLTRANEEANGLLRLQSELIGETLPFRFKAAASAVEALVLELGEKGLGGVLVTVVDFLTEGARALLDFENGLTRFQRVAAAVVGGLIGALGAAGLAGVLALLATFLGPTGIIVVGIGALAGALAAFVFGGEEATQQMIDFRRETNRTADAIRDLQVAIDKAFQAGDFRAAEQSAAALAATHAKAAEALRAQFAELQKIERLQQREEKKEPPDVVTRALGAPGIEVQQEQARVRGVSLESLRGAGGEFLPGAVRAAFEPLEELLRERLAVERQPNIELLRGFIPELTRVQERGLEELAKEVRRIAISGQVPQDVLDSESFKRLTVELQRAAEIQERASKEALRVETQAAKAADVTPPKEERDESARLNREIDAIFGAFRDPERGRKLDETRAKDLQDVDVELDRALDERIEKEKEVRKAFQEMNQVLAKDIELAGLSASKREEELAVIEARNLLKEVEIDLLKEEEKVIRDNVRAKQQVAARVAFDELNKALGQSVVLAGLSAKKREEEQVVMEARNILAIAHIDLLETEAEALRILVRQRQENQAKQAEAQLRADIDRQIGADIAGGIVDPIRQGILDSDTELRDVAEQMMRNFSAAMLDALVFDPLTEALTNLFAGVAGDTGIGGLKAEAILAGQEFNAQVTLTGTTFGTTVTTSGQTFSTIVVAAAQQMALTLAAAGGGGGGPGGILGAAGGIFSGLGSFGPSTTGAAAGNIQPGVSLFGSGVPGSGGFSSTGIPIGLEHGGVIDRPTLLGISQGRAAIGGEVPGKKEGVLPLMRTPGGDLGVIASGVGGGGGAVDNRSTSVTNNHNYNMHFSEQATFRRTMRHIKQDERRDLARTTETGGG